MKVFCECVSNPLFEIADIEVLSKITKKLGIQLLVDNTFSPLSISPSELGADGLKTVYPGLKSHSGHELFKKMMNEEYGFGGMLTVDVGGIDKANEFMEMMQDRNLGYLAVSLGFYKTLFSAPGSSTSSEIPEEE